MRTGFYLELVKCNIELRIVRNRNSLEWSAWNSEHHLFHLFIK